MPRPTIAEVRARADFQKTYEWYFSFLRSPSFPGGLSIVDTEFDITCMTTSVPHLTSNPATMMMRGEQIFDPGIYNVDGQLELEFIEDVGSTIRTMIKEWGEAMRDKTGTFTQLTADIRLATMNNQDVDNWDYWILWCFFETSSMGNLEGGSGEPMMPRITLRYTDFVQQPIT